VPSLLVMRHAKSDYPVGVDDRDRPLSPRGRADAEAAGRWIAAGFPHLDEVVVSPARRAQQTWRGVTPYVEASLVRTDDRIYDDWGERLDEVVADLHADAQTALIIGHNPGVEEWVLRNTTSSSDPARVRLSWKFPTSAVAVLRWDGAWTGSTQRDLLVFAVPRG